MKDKIKKYLNWKVIVIAIFILCIGIAISKYVIEWFSDENREATTLYFRSLGFLGWLMIIGIQVLQVVVAFIPGEPVELFVGFVYGPWLGLFTCLFGVLVGTAIIFYGVRRFGKKFINLFTNSEKLSKYKFLQNEARLEGTVFILFLIPGTPKDVLTYFVPLTKIEAFRFFVLSTIARIPSIISSTYAGDTMQEGNWIATVVIFAITGALGLLGIFINEKFIQKKS